MLAIVAQAGFAEAPAIAASKPDAQIGALSRSIVSRINAIRASFGLPPGQMTIAYRLEVLRAVQSNEDPPFAPTGGGVVGEESLWGLMPGSSAASNALALDVVAGWVYHDGWEGSTQATWNLDCTFPGAPGCNGHRRAVLSQPPVPGAKLYIDATTLSTNDSGAPDVAVAALLVWKVPS